MHNKGNVQVLFIYFYRLYTDLQLIQAVLSRELRFQNKLYKQIQNEGLLYLITAGRTAT